MSAESVAAAFRRIRSEAGEPEVLVDNAGYLEGRDLPPDMELLEYIPVEPFEPALHIAVRGPFLVAREVLPAMREAGRGSFLISNNAAALRGRKARHRPVALLSAGDDADPGPVADRAVLRARGARGQSGSTA